MPMLQVQGTASQQPCLALGQMLSSSMLGSGAQSCRQIIVSSLKPQRLITQEADVPAALSLEATGHFNRHEKNPPYYLPHEQAFSKFILFLCVHVHFM